MTEAPAKVHYFRDAEGSWRWNIQAQNGNILADSAEGYERVAFAVNGFHAVCRAVGGNPANLAVEMDEIHYQGQHPTKSHSDEEPPAA